MLFKTIFILILILCSFSTLAHLLVSNNTTSHINDKTIKKDNRLLNDTTIKKTNNYTNETKSDIHDSFNDFEINEEKNKNLNSTNYKNKNITISDEKKNKNELNALLFDINKDLNINLITIKNLKKRNLKQVFIFSRNCKNNIIITKKHFELLKICIKKIYIKLLNIEYLKNYLFEETLIMINMFLKFSKCADFELELVNNLIEDRDFHIDYIQFAQKNNFVKNMNYKIYKKKFTKHLKKFNLIINNKPNSICTKYSKELFEIKYMTLKEYISNYVKYFFNGSSQEFYSFFEKSLKLINETIEYKKCKSKNYEKLTLNDIYHLVYLKTYKIKNSCLN